MTCNASDLVNAAKCYCFPKGMAGAIQAWLLCKWAQIEIENPPPPCEFSIALDGPGRVILSWGNPVVYDLIEVWHAPLFGPRHLETTLPGTDTSWTTPILAPGDYFIIRGKIGDDYSGFATGDTCPPAPLCPPVVPFHWSPESISIRWIDSGGSHFGDYAFFLATADLPTVTDIITGGAVVTEIVGWQSLPLLTNVDALGSGYIESVDLSCCEHLKTVSFNTCDVLTSLNVSYCPLLASVDVRLSALNYLDVTGDVNLAEIRCDDIGPTLTNIQGLTGCLRLLMLTCGNDGFSSLDCHGLQLLQTLDCHGNQLGTLNITGDFAITNLDFSSNPAVVIIGP